MIVEPIKDKKKINDFLTFLKGKNERDWIMAKFQLNTGLRISDVVKVKVSDILTEKFNFKDYFVLQEQKTNKEKKIKLNDSIKTALSSYIKQNKLGHNNYIFSSRKGLNEHIRGTATIHVK
ncbi:tyrosine-type recombinase/integrase [Clostridium estertheticum]|uniref:tyrosine-type recombinase/integrase n=1 Tax=Clostridium estertheticum TaxID=238834 RepID=UPI00216393E0|nr:tyrosine-type recombinase/integrase [Clostridium estertheticum]